MRALGILVLIIATAVVVCGVSTNDKRANAWSCIDPDKFGPMTQYSDPIIEATLDTNGNPEWAEFFATSSYTLLNGLHRKELVRFSAPVWVGSRSQGHPLSCVSNSAYPLRKPSTYYHEAKSSAFSDNEPDSRIYYYPIEVDNHALMDEAKAALALINAKLGTDYKISSITAAGARGDTYNGNGGLIHGRTRFAVKLTGGVATSAVFESRHEQYYRSKPFARCDKLVVGPGTLIPVAGTTALDPALEDVSVDAHKYMLTKVTCPEN